MTDISTEAIARQLYGLEAAGHSPRMGTIPLIKALAAERDALIRERNSLIKTKREQLDRLKAERDDLKATNAELLEALKAWAEFDALPLDAKRPDIFEIMVLRKTRAAISKAEGKL